MPWQNIPKSVYGFAKCTWTAQQANKKNNGHVFYVNYMHSYSYVCMQKFILRNNIYTAACIACNTVVLHIKVSSYLYYKLHYVHTSHEVENMDVYIKIHVCKLFSSHI